MQPLVVSSLKPVDRPPALGDQVYEALRENLRNGAIGADRPLQVKQLAEQLGVSRTPVREALTRLAGEGALESDGRGFMLPAFGVEDMDNLYEVRFLIEPAALRRVAEFAVAPGTRRPIEEALADAHAAHAAGDADAFRDANRRFRSAWLALLPNHELVKVVEQYADHTQQIRALTLGSPEVAARTAPKPSRNPTGAPQGGARPGSHGARGEEPGDETGVRILARPML